MDAPSIAIVVTFFGPAPVWLPAFLLSCRRNPDVRWFVYADFDVTFPVPENVTITHIDLDEFNRRASDALAATVRVDRASLRKICDLKPVYGLMFADDLRGFDWWGCSDLDIVWGNIRSFVTDEVLQMHDVVSSRRHKLSGHFTLFRNNDAINRIFDLVPDATALLTTSAYEHFDERLLTTHLREYMSRGPGDACPRVFWPSELTVNAAAQRALPADGSLLWRDGRTFDAAGRELMYLHFHKLKQGMHAIDFGYADTPGSFVISRHGVFVRPPANTPSTNTVPTNTVPTNTVSA
jgi:hypothetical protein